MTIIGLSALLCDVDAVFAQAHIHRSEFICYDKREDAKSDKRSGIDKHLVVKPELQFESAEGAVRAVYEQQFDVPPGWIDYNTYLHVENVGADYTLFVNGVQVSTTHDQFTPADFYISPYIDEGANVVAIVVVLRRPFVECLKSQS